MRFRCYSSTAKWEFNHGYITGYAEQYAVDEIRIKHAYLNSTGYYSCFGVYNDLDYPKPFVAVAMLKVYGKYHLLVIASFNSFSACASLYNIFHVQFPLMYRVLAHSHPHNI